MKRNLLFTSLLLSSILVYAQQYVHSEATEKEVNDQVWGPFKQAYEARNWQTFNELHTGDVLRVSQWGGIKVGDAYKEGVKHAYQKNSTRKKTIDFWFEQRIYAETIGYEVGYYRVISEEPEKEPAISYAQFHVVLRKQNGMWKIAQDWDSTVINGVKLTAEDFAKGSVLVF